MIKKELTGITASDKRERFGIKKIKAFIEDESRHACRVLVLYGLAGTGGATLAQQVLGFYKGSAECIAYEVQDTDSMDDIYDMLEEVGRKGTRQIIWLKDITRAKDFISESAFLADFYATGKRIIVATGEDSFAFELASRDQLFDRMLRIRMNYIPFTEHYYLTGNRDVGCYVRYGGLLDGKPRITGYESACHYIECNIAENIFRSIQGYKWLEALEGVPLADLKAFVNAMVSACSGVFAKDQMRELLRQVAENEGKLVSEILKFIEDGYIASIHAEHGFIHRKASKELYSAVRAETGEGRGYTPIIAEALEKSLRNLDVIFETEQVDFTKEDGKWEFEQIVTPFHVIQPTIKYACLQQGRKFVESDEYFNRLPARERGIILAALDNKIEKLVLTGIVLFDVGKILSEAKSVASVRMNSRRFEVIKPAFYDDGKLVGGYDMLVHDYESRSHWAFIVSPSFEQACEQEKRFHNEGISSVLESRLGKRQGAAVLYKGDSFINPAGTIYLNIQDFLLAVEKRCDMEKAFKGLADTLPMVDHEEE